MRSGYCYNCDAVYTDYGVQTVSDLQHGLYQAHVYECKQCGILIFEDIEARKLWKKLTPKEFYNRCIEDLIRTLEKLKFDET